VPARTHGQAGEIGYDMNASTKRYFDKLLSAQNAKTVTSPPPKSRHDGAYYHQMGVEARALRLYMDDVIKHQNYWRELSAASPEQVDCFVRGFYGKPMPAAIVPDEPPVIETAQEIAPIVQEPDTQAEIVEIVNPMDEARAMLDHLKRLAELMEAKLNQPIEVHVSAPKLKRSVDTVTRDADENLAGKVTQYEYEE